MDQLAAGCFQPVCSFSGASWCVSGSPALCRAGVLGATGKEAERQDLIRCTGAASLAGPWMGKNGPDRLPLWETTAGTSHFNSDRGHDKRTRDSPPHPPAITLHTRNKYTTPVCRQRRPELGSSTQRLLLWQEQRGPGSWLWAGRAARDPVPGRGASRPLALSA